MFLNSIFYTNQIKVYSRFFLEQNGEQHSSDSDSSDSEEESEFPHSCYICRKEFIEPVVTKCKHYFCEKCALDRYKSGKTKCKICNTPTLGIFNTAKLLIKNLKEAK